MAARIPSHVAADTRAFRVPDHVFAAVAGGRRDAASDVHVVLVLDSSGSMRWMWPAVAAAVNDFAASRHNAHVLKFATASAVRTAPLLEDQSRCAQVDADHGYDVGFGTDLAAAAGVLRTHLSALAAAGARNFSVVFVSDGQGFTDNLAETCQDIRLAIVDKYGARLEFTALGVGERFPTSVVMTMRSALHNGRASVPLVSLVTNADDFRDALAGLAPHLEHTTVAAEVVERRVRTVPWDDESSTLSPGVWYLIGKDVREVVLVDPRQESTRNMVTVSLVDEQWTEKSLVELGKQLTWRLQVVSLEKSLPREEIQARAVSAEVLMQQAASNCLVPDHELSRPGPRASVYERVQHKKKKTVHYILQGIRKELRLLAEGTVLDGLSDEEMAKRLAIGTMEGKYHQRAMAWKGLSHEDFMMYLSHFIRVLEDDKALQLVEGMKALEKSAGLTSAISLETTADILTQQNLREGLRMMPSQYTLVESIPLVGLAVNVHRSAGSMISPWNLRVKNILTLTPVLDTVSLLEMNSATRLSDGVRVSLPIGNDESEVANAVCSLVATQEHAAVMRPYLTSGLYSILHTHWACGNADTIDFDSHCALLAGVVCHVLDVNNKQSSHADWMRLTLLTFRELYPRFGLGDDAFLTSLVDDPASAVVTAHPSLQTECESLSKPISVALAWQENIRTEARRNIFDHVVKEWVGRAVGKRRNVTDWFFLENVALSAADENGNEFTAESIVARLDVKSHFAPSDLAKEAVQVLKKCEFRVSSDDVVGFDHHKLVNTCFSAAVSYPTLEQFGRVLMNDASLTVPEKDLRRYVMHAVKFSASFCRRARVEDVDMAKVGAKLRARLELEAERNFRKSVREHAWKAWNDTFAAAHCTTVSPLSARAIMERRAKMGFAKASLEDLGYRKDVGLCAAACMVDACPFYLQARTKASTALHYTAAAERRNGNVVALCRTVSSAVRDGEKDSSKVLDMVASGCCMQYEDASRKRRLGLIIQTSSKTVLSDIERLIPLYDELYTESEAPGTAELFVEIGLFNHCHSSWSSDLRRTLPVRRRHSPVTDSLVMPLSPTRARKETNPVSSNVPDGASKTNAKPGSSQVSVYLQNAAAAAHCLEEEDFFFSFF